MKLLFSDSDFSADFKKYVSYADADFEFTALRPDLRNATRDMISVVGKEVYDAVYSLYNAVEVVELFRYAIAVNAYRYYVPNNDLAHTGDGRKMRNDDHEKSAFQWQIDADNEAQERRYYKALDSVIDYLEAIPEDDDASPEIEALSDLWQDSENRKALRSLFVNDVSTFDRYFVINSRLLLIKLTPGLKLFERRELKPRLSASVWTELKQLSEDNIEPEDDKLAKALELIHEASVNYALDWGIPKMSINLFPTGILQQYISDRASTTARKTPMLNESEWARQSFEKTWRATLIELENLYAPEQAASCPSDVNPPFNTGQKFFST